MPRLACCVFALLFVPALAPAADIPDALVGRWVSQDAERRPVEFAKDGTCRYGWEKKDGAWVMAAGTFHMEAADRARFRIEHGGVVLGKWFRLKDGVLETPLPPKGLTWKKDEKK